MTDGSNTNNQPPNPNEPDHVAGDNTEQPMFELPSVPPEPPAVSEGEPVTDPLQSKLERVQNLSAQSVLELPGIAKPQTVDEDELLRARAEEIGKRQQDASKESGEEPQAPKSENNS